MQTISPWGMTPPPFSAPVALPDLTSSGPTSFDEALWQALQQAGNVSQDARGAVEQSLVGEDLSMVESFTAVREADLALRMMIQIRNKLMDAYQEIQQLRM